MSTQDEVIRAHVDAIFRDAERYFSDALAAAVSNGDLPAIDGVRLATAATGVKYKGRDDLLLCVLDTGATIAGVLTNSKTCLSCVSVTSPDSQPLAVRADKNNWSSDSSLIMLSA